MIGARCLLTGGTGFLGRHVATTLADMGHEIMILARNPSPDFGTLVADIASPGLSLPSSRFDLVCHMAGLAHVVPSDAETRSRFRQVNVKGTEHLLCAIEAVEMPAAFVLVSTVAVYGCDCGYLLDEETPREATDPYGASKREAEDLVTAWCAAHGVRCAILRLPLVAGRRPPGNLGAMLRALTNGRYFGVGAGRARRSMVWADDVAHIIPAAAQAGGAFHLTDGRHPTYAEMEAALCSALGMRAPRRIPCAAAAACAAGGDALQALLRRPMPLNRRIYRKLTSTLTFSDERAKRELGWSPSSVLSHASEIVA